MGELEMDEEGNLVKKPFYLNMIEDIRQNLQANNENNGVEFKVKFEKEKNYEFLDGSKGTADVTRMLLSSRESVIANIDIVIDQEEDEKHSSNFKKNNYFLRIVVTTSNKDQNFLSIKIPMISRDHKEFEYSMK